jgi:hypothetical protein
MVGRQFEARAHTGRSHPLNPRAERFEHRLDLPASRVWSRGENRQLAFLSWVGASRDWRVEDRQAMCFGELNELIRFGGSDTAHLQPDRLPGPLSEHRLHD